MTWQENEAVGIFISYSRQDVTFLKSVLMHLRALEKRELVRVFFDRKLAVGVDWRSELERGLQSAKIVLLLVSPAFIGSEECDREVSIAMARYTTGEAEVVPVIIHPCDWRREQYGKLNAVPGNGRPIALWRFRHEPLNELTQRIAQLILERNMVAQPSNPVGARPSEREPMQPDAEEVVGFDLGHGESAVARVSLAPLATPQIVPVNNKRSQLTAIGLLDGMPVVGDTVVHSPRVTNLRLGFKVRPPGTDDSRAALVAFVRAYATILTSTKQILGGERTHYFVGRPSGWTREEAEAYRDLLEPVLRRVTVVPESRAALIQAKEEYTLAPDHVRASILIVDLGSSTIDVSVVFGGIQDESLDTGVDLGGHLIEKEMLRRAIARSPQRDELTAFFAGEDGHAHLRVCEAQCREFKERYWNDEKIAKDERRRAHIDVGTGRLFVDVFLDGAEMEDILTTPMPELGSESWNGRLRRFLDDVHTMLNERNRIPEVVVLTGGPSAMSFVRELCAARFLPTRFVWCTPTEETVALGLARWGRIQLQTSAFADEVQAFCDTVLPKFVQQQIESLRDDIARELAQRISTTIIAPTLREWRADTLPTLQAMKTAMVERTLSWLRSNTGMDAVRTACGPVFDRISEDVNRATFHICTRHDIPPSSMHIDLTVPFGDQFKVSVETPFDAAIGVANGITAVTLFVLGAIAKAFIGVTTFAGAPGWLVAAIAAAWIAFFGISRLEDSIEDIRLPLGMRSRFLSEEKLKRLVADGMPAIQSNLKAAIGETEMQRVLDTIGMQVSDFLNTRASDVKWIIADGAGD